MATSCKNCGCANQSCGCKDSYLTTPPPCPTPDDCPEAQPCSEVFDAQCIVYTGDDIVCDETTVVAQNTNVADALNQIVDYVCTQPVACCPTFAVDIVEERDQNYLLTAQLTNGTAPFTYEWTIQQSALAGMDFAGVTNLDNVIMVTVPTLYVPAVAISGNLFQSLVKVKVTDAVGQIATAYYMAGIIEYPPA